MMIHLYLYCLEDWPFCGPLEYVSWVALDILGCQWHLILIVIVLDDLCWFISFKIRGRISEVAALWLFAFLELLGGWSSGCENRELWRVREIAERSLFSFCVLEDSHSSMMNSLRLGGCRLPWWGLLPVLSCQDTSSGSYVTVRSGFCCCQ